MTSPAIPSSAQPMVNSAGNIMPVWQRFFNALNLKLQQAAPAETLKKVAFSGSYQDLSNRPVLGSAASTDATAYATAAQGTLADNAVPKIRQIETTDGDIVGGGSLSSDLTLGLAETGVAADSYGAYDAVPSLTLDAKGRVTSASVKLAALTTVATDEDFTWTHGSSGAVIVHTGILTADRTVTLAGGNANGQRARFVRTGTDAFNLSIGGLKSLATGTWAEIAYDGSSWALIGAGSL